MLTSDFVVPLSILKPVSAFGIKKANTLRLWNLAARTIISTIEIPSVSGLTTLFSTFTDNILGRWYSGRQVHPGQRGERCPCYVSI